MAPPKGFRHTPEAIAKIAAAGRGRTFSAECIALRAAKWRGRKLTPEQCERLAAAKRGKPLTPEHIAAMKAGLLASPKVKLINVGRKLTPEHKAKISAAGIGNAHTKGRPLSEEHKAKVSAALKGRPKTEAHRQAAANAIRKSPAFMAALNAKRPKAHAAARAKGVVSNPSSIELIVRGFLLDLNIDHIPQHQIGRYTVDVFVPAHKLVIECDGTYWHRNTQDADRRRDEYMRDNGLSVLRLPEPVIRSGEYVRTVRQILDGPMQ